VGSPASTSDEWRLDGVGNTLALAASIRAEGKDGPGKSVLFLPGRCEGLRVGLGIGDSHLGEGLGEPSQPLLEFPFLASSLFLGPARLLLPPLFFLASHLLALFFFAASHLLAEFVLA